MSRPKLHIEPMTREAVEHLREIMSGELDGVDPKGPCFLCDEIRAALDSQPEQICERCEGVGDVTKNFGIDPPGRPEIVPCPDCQPQKPREGEWPPFVVQRFEQDDPLRPYRYVVLDGTQSTDFTNCRPYVPATSNPSHQSPLLRVAEELEEKAKAKLKQRDERRTDHSNAGIRRFARLDAEAFTLRGAAQRLREEAVGLGEEVSNGAALIAAERQRQVTEEGWSPDHDAEHDRGELVAAAKCYLDPGCFIDTSGFAAPEGWPWDAAWWKPVASSGGPEALGVVTDEDRIRNLSKAGALIAAEIDRLQRAALPPDPQEGER